MRAPGMPVTLEQIAGQALLLLFLTSPASPQTTLNLSQDLVPLGIASTNMVPNQPSLDASPLLQGGVAYAKAHGISVVVADPGTYYFLSVTDNTNAGPQLGRAVDPVSRFRVRPDDGSPPGQNAAPQTVAHGFPRREEHSLR